MYPTMSSASFTCECVELQSHTGNLMDGMMSVFPMWLKTDMDTAEVSADMQPTYEEEYDDEDQQPPVNHADAHRLDTVEPVPVKPVSAVKTSRRRRAASVTDTTPRPPAKRERKESANSRYPLTTQEKNMSLTRANAVNASDVIEYFVR
jgi:hypothetical protein